MKNKVIKILFIIICVILLTGLLGIGALAIYVSKSLDLEKDEALFEDARTEKSIRFYYDEKGSDSIENYEPILYKELGSTNVEWYKYDEFSSYLIKGFVAMEDRGFFTHHGIDLKRTLAAVGNYIFKGNKKFGGSTITQQVIKNISGKNEKTVKRKLDEIIRAYHIEYAHSKEEIFELYLNVIPMSNNLYGAPSASKSFFGKEPSELTAAEAATIIAVANAPTRYNPYRNADDCKEKRDKVLYVMYTEGVIDYGEYTDAKSTPVSVIPWEKSERSLKTWFTETVLDDVIRDLMDKYDYSYEAANLFLYKNGASIYTTVNPLVQKELEEYFENYDNFPSECKDGLEYSMVITDARSNLLRGIVGSVGKKSGNGGYNYALTERAPGSALKPLALYLPLINDRKITAATVFDDVPVKFFKNSNGEYTEYPKNYPNVYSGLITVSDAIRLSKNTVAVRLYNMLGAEKVYKYLTENFGFNTLVYSERMEKGTLTDLAPSPLALGQLSRGISLRKLTEAYNVFSDEGKFKNSRSYIAVFNADGKTIIESSAKEKRISSPEAARLMTELLKNVVENGTASKITLKNLYDTAGKTGTSGNDRDRLFIGYTPYYTAGIWCGYPDKSSPVGAHEKNHFTVWDEVMKALHEKTVGYEDVEKSFSTEGLVYCGFCKDSGKLFSPQCSHDVRGDRLDFGYFIKGSEPMEICDRHVIIYENMFPLISKISLVRMEERIFPKDITVTDEKYAYREKRGKEKIFSDAIYN